MTGRMTLLVLGVLLLVLAAAFLGAESEDRSAFTGRYTSFSAAPDGARALWALSDRLGYQPERTMANFEALPGEGTLLCVEPQPLATGLLALFFGAGTFSDSEVESVQRWVEEGNTFVLIASEENELHEAFSALLHAEPGGAAPEKETDQDGPRDADADDDAPAPIAWPPPLALATPALSPLASLQGVERVRVEAKAPAVLLRSIHVGDDEEEAWPTGWTPLLRDEAGRVHAAEVRRGAGRVIFLSSPYLITNRGLRDEDNAVLLARLLRPERGRLYIDEFHHGFRQERGLSSYLRDSSLWLAVCQLLLLLLFLGWRVSSRFGPPLGFYEEEARGSGDYVRAMSRIYAQGGHDQHALQVLLDDLGRACVDRFKLPGEARGEALASALEQAGQGGVAAQVRPLLAEVDQLAAAKRRRPARTLAVAARLARLIAELRGQRGAGAYQHKGSP